MEFIRLTDDTLKDAARRAAAVLKKGGIVLFPTDTLYGLAADAMNRPAIERLKRIKARETKKPIHVVVRDHEALDEYVHMNDRARELASRHLPGALTLVLPGTGRIPDEILLNGTLGVRIPDDPFARELAHAFGTPYTATSANMAGLPTPAHPNAVLEQLGRAAVHIDLVIDDGPREGGKPSTVVAVIGDAAYVLREGRLSREELGI